METAQCSNPWILVGRQFMICDQRSKWGSHSISRTYISCDRILLTDPKYTLLKLSFPSTCAAHNKQKWNYLYYIQTNFSDRMQRYMTPILSDPSVTPREHIIYHTAQRSNILLTRVRHLQCCPPIKAHGLVAYAADSRTDSANEAEPLLGAPFILRIEVIKL